MRSSQCVHTVPKVPGVAWLSYCLVVLFLLALLEAILLSWQHTPVWGKIPGPEVQGGGAAAGGSPGVSSSR